MENIWLVSTRPFSCEQFAELIAELGGYMIGKDQAVVERKNGHVYLALVDPCCFGPSELEAMRIRDGGNVASAIEIDFRPGSESEELAESVATWLRGHAECRDAIW